MVRESGASSTLRPIVSITAVSAMLDLPSLVELRGKSSAFADDDN
jgi:hypothetical protein